jgi:uncharacterized phage protein gp47/JayE
VLRVISDVQGGLCHLTLQFVDWLAKQLLPDTAETEWLDRHANIWLVNADGTTGRKMATLAYGTVNFTGVGGTIVPIATQLESTVGIAFETTEQITLASPDGTLTPCAVRALDPGAVGNLAAGTGMSFPADIGNVDSVTVVEISGGTDEENDDDLRLRVLERIRQPPMGGDKTDYTAWMKAVGGVTRAWTGALEQGIGTVTCRFMMDELRAANNGFPTTADCQTVRAYLDTVRPVAVKDFFVVAPIPQRVDVYINNLVPDTTTIRADIQASLEAMLIRHAEPGQTIYAAWKYQTIMDTPGVEHFELRVTDDDVMPSPGHMAVLGDIVYGFAASTA